jgi:hypothetical protein
MNILSLIKSQLPPQAISQISNTIGESPENTKSALGTAFPAVLGSLLGKANASPDGATQIYNTLQQNQGSWTDSIGSMLSGGTTGTTGAPAQTGSGSLLNSLLGSKLGPVAEFISGHTGIKSSSATSLLGMAAPIVMGILGKQVTSQGLGAAGLGQLLNSQAEHLKDALPAGLANTLGIGSLLSGSHDTTRVPTDASQATYTAPRGVPVGRAAPQHKSSPLTWAVPLIVAVALALWAFSRNANRRAPAVGGTQDYVQTQAGHGASMPDLSHLNLPPGSIADRIANAVKSGDWSQKFDLQNLNFDSTGHLTDSSSSELKEIGSVMKAAPNLKLSVTGYGPTADEGTAKANSIKSAITATGISEERIITHGNTGSEAPSLKVSK